MKPRLSAEELRVKIKLNIEIDPVTGCWNWKKSRGSHGYGQIATGGTRNETVHRVSLEVFKGDLANGLLVMHSCDNRRCCNPAHLSSGTHSDNLKDAISKGRHSAPAPDNRGSKHGMSKLTEEVVRSIRADSRPRKELALEYGVSVQTISNIRGGKTWQHVTSTLVNT